MRNRVERLRLWLLAGAGVLVLVLAVFIGSARYLMHHFLAKLPTKLGVDIKSETNGFTYSQSLQGKTIYTIHAAKELEHRDGKITLHDVTMVLYGRKGDRADAIKGDEFEYDQSAGMVRAIGLVHIDLKAADAAAAVKPDRPGKGKGRAHKGGASEAKILHATTSGLIYMDKLGVAATSEPIEFELAGMTGHAVGADYNSDTGVLLLHSAVSMDGMAGKRPVRLTAAAAELDSHDQRAVLTGAKYRTGADNSEGKTVEAEQATLHRRADGSLERIEARGNVTSEGPNGKVVSQRADVMLSEESQPKSAVLEGGVTYSLDEPLQQRRGHADAANIAFDAEGRASRAVFTGDVHMTERTRATEAAKEPWSTRELTAAKVDAGLVAVDGHRSVPRDVEASGNARLTVVKNGSLANAKGKETTEIAADDLKAHLIGSGNAKEQLEVDTIAGRGHTSLHKVDAEGKEQTSTADSLDAKFRPGAGRLNGAADGGREISDALQSSVQVGHLTMMQRTPAKAGAKTSAPDVEDASAERAVYDGDADHMTLSGGVQLRDAGSLIWANQVTLDHKTSDALAEGAVKVNYVQEEGAKTKQGGAESAEPTHILADRAEVVHATQVATFYGKPVRLWQGGSQVQAPVIEFSKAEKRVVARGVAGGTGAQVHTVLLEKERDPMGVAKPVAGKPAKSIFESAKTGAGSPRVARIASGELVYLGLVRQADFTGGVRLESGDGTMMAREAVVYLTPPDAAAKSVGSVVPASGVSANAASGDLALNGRVERVVATGHIELEQTGRRATGEKLVYTASDELSVLTGAKDAPPKVVDSVKGTSVTGAALLFHLNDESVEALSTAPGEQSSGQRVRTDAEVNEEKKSGKEGKGGKGKL